MTLTDFPALVDIFPVINGTTDNLNTAGKLHDELHNLQSEAMAAVERLLVAMGNVKNVMDPTYGAIEGAGTLVNTTAINAAFAAVQTSGKPGRVFIPTGVSLAVDLNALTGATNCDLFGGGTLTTPSVAAGAFIIANGKTNFRILDIGFSSTNDNAVAVQHIDCTDPVVEGCRTANARLVVTGSGLYSSQTAANATTGARITNNTCTFTGTLVTGSACIWLYYARGARCSGNTITGYNQGIVWWGGDSATDGAVRVVTTRALTSNVVTITTSVAHGYVTGDVVLVSSVGVSFDGLVTLTGAPTTTTFTYAKTAANVASAAGTGVVERERKCLDITITTNTVIGSAGGGIWGSMGWRVTVTGNTVSGCGDVGIDFEGTWTGTASGNTVENCVGGNLTTFYANRGIKFIGNTCTWTTAGVMVRVQSGFGFAFNWSVSFTGNILVGLAGISVISIEPTRAFTWTANECTNVRGDTLFNNQGDTTFEGGYFHFDTVAPAAFNVLNIGANHIGGRVSVHKVSIRSFVTQPAGSKGIWTWHDDSTADVRQWIDWNTVEGFPISIASEWHGSNAGFRLRLWVRNNTIDVGTTMTHSDAVAPAAAGAATVVMVENYYANGTVAP